jgi:DNA-binding GntR family transcriptional regulator
MMSGDMQSGQIYSAPTLAEQFGTSATPVREAMLDLTNEGLVEVVRNKGFRVVHLTDADLEALAEVRRLLEVPTVGQLARTAERPALEALRPLAARIDQIAKQHDVVEYVKLDREFHLELLSLAGNPILVDIVGDLRNRSRLALLREWSSTDELAQNSREHFLLIDQLVAGDAKAAEALVRGHIGRM